ncbi:MAG: helix-turn-helix domain-containing protein, partial [Romboutsia timonensis]
IMKSEKNVGQRIKEILEEKGIQAKTVAEYLGVTQAAMSNYLNNKRNIDTDTLTKIAEFLGVTTDELLGLPTKRTRRLARGLNALLPEGYLEDVKKEKEKELLKTEEAMQLFTQLTNSQKDMILNLARDLVDNNNRIKELGDYLSELSENVRK